MKWPCLQNANAFDVTKWNYAPAEGQPGVNKGQVKQSSVRVTWQATPRNKIAGTYKVDKWCACPNFISATRAPEAAADRRFPRLRQEHLEWTSTVSNRLMFEAVGLHLFERWGNMDLREEGGSLESAAQEAAVHAADRRGRAGDRRGRADPGGYDLPHVEHLQQYAGAEFRLSPRR